MPAARRTALAQLVPALIGALPQGPGWLLGLNGAPGTGKSTLAGMLAAAEAGTERPSPDKSQKPIAVLSLDDYYLSRNERRELAQTIHPSLAQRGVPGTHNLQRLFKDIDRLLAGHEGTLSLPVFNKSLDEPERRERELMLDDQPARIILEGWFVGLPPLDTNAPGNSPLDENEKALQQYVTGQHEAFHKAWSDRGNALWAMSAPDFETVCQWRWQQEQDLPREQRMLRAPADVRRFLKPFEPLIRYQLRHVGCGTDLVIRLDRDHHPDLQCTS